MALRAVPDHPKFARLKNLLHAPKGVAMGWLEAVWHFGGRFTPQGNIGKYPDEAIEAWVEWDGKPGVLIGALVISHWLDPDKEYRLLIHDWAEHADKATKNLLLRRNLQFLVPSVRTEYVLSTYAEDIFKYGVHPAYGLPEPEPVPEPVPVPVPEPEGLSPSSALREPTIVRPTAFVEAWNQLCKTLPRVERFSDSRRKKVHARINQGVTLEQFERAVRACTEKPFLRGEGERGWMATFDWLIDNDRNIEKAITGYNGVSKVGANGKGDSIVEIAGQLICEHYSGPDTIGDIPWGEDGQESAFSLREEVGPGKRQ